MDLLAFLLLIALAILALARIVRPRGTRGEQGEAKVSTGITRLLDRESYHLINDVTLPLGNGTTQIDHLVFSPYGIFVVETKNMTGWIFGGANQRQWTQVIYAFRQRFQNPLDQNEVHAKAVRNLLRLNSDDVHNVVVFVGTSDFKTPMPPEVVHGVSDLASLIQTKNVAIFSPAAVDHFIARVQNERLEPGIHTDRIHVRNVEARLSDKASGSGIACPICGGGMVERLNGRTGDCFLGCSRFPQCRGGRSLS